VCPVAPCRWCESVVTSSVRQLVGLFTAVSVVLCMRFCSLASHCAKWVSVCVVYVCAGELVVCTEGAAMLGQSGRIKEAQLRRLVWG
jgi:hypothetical protein